MSGKKGFTLVELLVVVSILAILATIGLSVYSGVQKNARVTKRVSDLKKIEMALELYYSNNRRYPISPSWRSECSIWGEHSPDSVIPGLVPEYLRGFPADPQMDIVNNKSCYLYQSNSDGSGYKLLNHIISEFSQADYRKYRELIDPNRDGGSDGCKVDGDNIWSWAIYTNNACGL